MFAKAKDVSSLLTWCIRRKRSASVISILLVEADLVFWLNYDLWLFGHSFVFCSSRIAKQMADSPKMVWSWSHGNEFDS